MRKEERMKEEKEREMVGEKIALDTGSNEKTAFDALMRSKPGPSMKSSPAKLIKGKRGRPRKHAPKIPLPPLYVFIRNMLLNRSLSQNKKLVYSKLGAA